MHDISIVRLKKLYSDPNYPFEDMIKLIPDEFHSIFNIIWNVTFSLEDIIDYRNRQMIINALDKMNKNIYLEFSSKFRENNTLENIIIEKFFDRILTIYNPSNLLIEGIDTSTLNNNINVVLPDEDILKLEIHSDMRGLSYLSLESVIGNIVNDYSFKSAVEKIRESTVVEINDEGISQYES